MLASLRNGSPSFGFCVGFGFGFGSDSDHGLLIAELLLSAAPPCQHQRGRRLMVLWSIAIDRSAEHLASLRRAMFAGTAEPF